MREQIKRILGLVKDGRLSHDDAITLLAALNPKLVFRDETMLQLFGLLNAEEFGVDRVVDLMLHRIEAGTGQQAQAQWGGGQQSQSQSQQSRPASGSQPSATFKIGGTSYPLDGLGEAISSQVEATLGGFLGRASGRPARPGTILRIETSDAHGASFSANLPLSLATHAERLIPPHALAALEQSGLGIDALKLLLQAGPPPGPLLEASDEHGNSVELSIR
jgi:hypothetical protein